MQLLTFEGNPVTGELVDRALRSIFPDLRGFQMGIDISRFLSLRITGIIFTGNLTNAVVGVAMQKNCNLIVTTESNFDRKCLLKKFGGVLEQCFKHGIYLYSITDNLVISKNIHIQVLKRVFDQTTFFSAGGDGGSTIHLFFDQKVHLKSLIQRFLTGSLFFSFGHSIDTSEISTMSLILNGEMIGELNANPDFIISIRLDPPLLDYCKRNKIPLLWIQKQLWLNEITREIQYLFSLSIKVKSFYFQIPPFSFSVLT